MPQESKEPTQTFEARAGLPASPQTLEVHPPLGDLKPWDLDSVAGFEHMGRPRPRVEGPLKVTGKARYTHDVRLPGMLYGRMIGASVPAGEILSIDTSKAEALPGVEAVWTTESRVVRFAIEDGDVGNFGIPSDKLGAGVPDILEQELEQRDTRHRASAHNHALPTQLFGRPSGEQHHALNRSIARNREIGQ